MSGKHIELFLVDGTPGGLTTAEIIGWTGHVLRGERQQLADFLKREEATRNGAYILLGDDESAPGGVAAYIGRSENLADRFRQHAARKEFWDRFVVITTKDETFTEGHWGYLEARLVELAREADRARLDNGNDPRGRRLTEAQSSDMEAFLGQLQIVLPVLGINLIRGSSRKTHQLPVAPTESVVFTLTDAKSGVQARAQVIDGEFTVLKGSRVVAEWTRTGRADSTQRSYASYRAHHQQLISEGSVSVDEVHGIVTRDIQFASPSTAAAVCLGRSSNGRREWTWDGGTYAQWEARDLDA